MNRPFITQPFVTPASAYVGVYMAQMAKKYWWAVALPLLIFTALALVDVRFIFLVLILIFNIFPFALLNIYFSKLLTKSAQHIALPKHLVIDLGRQLLIEYEPIENRPTPESESISWSDIVAVGRHRDYLTIAYSTADLLLIPASVLSAEISDALFETTQKQFIFNE